MYWYSLGTLAVHTTLYINDKNIVYATHLAANNDTLPVEETDNNETKRPYRWDVAK